MIQKRGKKGQITAFIILGLVILLSVSVSIYYISQTRLFLFEQKLSGEYAPVQIFVKNCVKSVSEDAINLVGMKGGYINTPLRLKEQGAFLTIDREANYEIPYWYKSGNIYPELDEIGEHISLYVKNNLENCLDFSVFDQFDVKVLSDPVVLTRIGDEVIVEVLYPIEVNEKGSEQIQKIENHRVSIPVRLKHTYELAKTILEENNNNFFLEQQILNLMFMHPDIPVSDVRFQCKSLKKRISDVRTTLRELINYNMADIRINKTRFTEFVSGNKDYASQNFIWTIDGLSRNFKDFSVSFDYELDYPMQMFVSPNDRYYLRAEPAKLFDLVPTCYLQYHFTYDLEFPITITITDEETANHEAFTFIYSFPLMINHNKPDRTNAPSHLIDNIIPTYDSTFCENYPRRSLAVEARNKITNRPISGVDVRSQCIQYECEIGEIQPYFGVYKLEAEFPECRRANIIGSKEGYLDGELLVDTTVDHQQIQTIHMMPVKSFNLTVVKHPLSNPSVQVGLTENEFIAITIKNQKYDFEETSFYINRPDITGLTSNQINLLDSWNYEYEVELSLIKGDDDIVGGYKANWTVPWRDIVDNNNIIFHVFEEPAALDNDDIMFDLLLNMHLNSTQIPGPELVP